MVYSVARMIFGKFDASSGDIGGGYVVGVAEIFC